MEMLGGLLGAAMGGMNPEQLKDQFQNTENGCNIPQTKQIRIKVADTASRLSTKLNSSDMLIDLYKKGQMSLAVTNNDRRSRIRKVLINLTEGEQICIATVSDVVVKEFQKLINNGTVNAKDAEVLAFTEAVPEGELIEFTEDGSIKADVIEMLE